MKKRDARKKLDAIIARVAKTQAEVDLLKRMGQQIIDGNNDVIHAIDQALDGGKADVDAIRDILANAEKRGGKIDVDAIHTAVVNAAGTPQEETVKKKIIDVLAPHDRATQQAVLDGVRKRYEREQHAAVRKTSAHAWREVADEIDRRWGSRSA